MADKKPNPKSPKNAPLGKGMADRARKLILNRQKGIDGTIEDMQTGRKPKK